MPGLAALAAGVRPACDIEFTAIPTIGFSASRPSDIESWNSGAGALDEGIPQHGSSPASMP